MKSFPISLALVTQLLGWATALPTRAGARTPVLEARALPTVTAPAGTIVGSSLLDVDSFVGIPFAESNVTRLKPPVRLANGAISNLQATGLTAASCPQMFFSTDSSSLLTEVLGDLIDSPFIQTTTGISEDCLTVNVMRPAGTTAGANLPVLFWIYGGGFELGGTWMYSAYDLMLNGIGLGKPFVFVAVNYRVAGFGFLPGKEILADGAANLGLLDQRMGLEWTADNIASFGGDPDQVTIWGESAGAISVFDQMALYNGDNTYNGKALFRAGIMDSGSIVPADPVDCPRAQAIYDMVVDAGGCSSASDTLECLRALDYETYLNAANSVPGLLSYTSVALSYVPRPDGTAMTASPEVLVANGQYAAVPMIIGDQEDEGTLFSLFQSNITTEDELVDYLYDVFFFDTTKELLADLVATYDSAQSAGSPFNTGIFNDVYPEFKRLAAILGDLVFTLTRRGFLNYANTVHPEVPSWSYLSSYDYGTPILGTFHGSDLLQVFYGILPNYASGSIQSYYINFLYEMTPGSGVKGNYPAWPQWSKSNQLMQFWSLSSNLLTDNFRQDSYEFIMDNVASLHI